MKLKTYLTENKITQEEFIAQVKETTGHEISQGGLSKYVIGQRVPRKDQILAIYKTTDGAVDPNSFYL